jgi:hypothetical protein
MGRSATAPGREVPPPAGYGPDHLDHTARQVRIDGRDDTPVHRLLGQPYTVHGGRQYRVVCNQTLSAFGGAILTTREATCEGCGGRRRG